MSVRRKSVALAIAASIITFGSLQQIALAQPPSPPPTSTPGLTDTPVAPPNTEAMRLAGIAKDNAREFGSSPDDPGPLAKDVSPAITPAAIEKATRKVADWELTTFGQYFGTLDRSRQLDGRIWTWSALYAGYMAASSEFGEGKYRDAMEQVGKAYDWGLITKLDRKSVV